MITVDDLKTRAGLLLYRQLPDEYRFLDLDTAAPGELRDLEAYLHGFGHLLDLIRGTTAQAYADAFAEAIDFDDQLAAPGERRSIQTWLLPYLAELVGAELLAPDPPKRVDELNNAVGWFKTKGTLGNVDGVADVVSGAETVVVEGWRRVLTTPRLALPPFTAPADAMGDDDPLGPVGLPLGTPDFRLRNRAIEDPQGANPLYRLVTQVRDADGRKVAEPVVSYWKPRAVRGVPCFAGAYDDTALRTPDLRDPRVPDVGPHPRRTMIHVRPPYGFFEPGLKVVTLPAGANPLGFDLATPNTQTYGPAEVLAALGTPLDPAPDKIVIDGDLTIPPDLSISFEDLLFTGSIDVESGVAGETRLTLRRCAAARVVLGPPGDTPTLDATDCLFGEMAAELVGGGGFARLVYCTVLGETHCERLWASDCIFVGDLVDVDCGGDDTCIRFSRIPDLGALAGCVSGTSPSNTTNDPNFIRLHFDDGDDCVLRPAAFGEPGCGVLDLTTSAAIREGAEDEGEMGAGHHLFHSAQLRALRLKLADFLPMGQEIAARYDRRLARPAARVA